MVLPPENREAPLPRQIKHKFGVKLYSLAQINGHHTKFSVSARKYQPQTDYLRVLLN
jgi:hypothetical protein